MQQYRHAAEIACPRRHLLAVGAKAALARRPSSLDPPTWAGCYVACRLVAWLRFMKPAARVLSTGGASEKMSGKGARVGAREAVL